MMFAKTTTLLALVAASAVSADDSHLRGNGDAVGQFACSIAGAPGQDACDDAEDTDGTGCVWCSMTSFGFCVSEEQAEKIKDTIPIVTCDDDGSSDDDVEPAADDDEVAADDDEATADDDSAPDEYWKCLKSSKDEKTCDGAGCTWCMTKAGYGICLEAEAAEQADESDWFSCSAGLKTGFAPAADPLDTSCLIASLSGEDSCDSTRDQDGQACEWCTVSGYGLCLSVDQADIAGQAGAICGESSVVSSSEESISDPWDTSCLVATLSGDEASCEATLDEDGEACEWCSVAGQVFCLTGEQAEIAGQIGAQCGERAATKFVADPYDPSCLIATLSQDEGACEATNDADGDACEWCSIGAKSFCVTSEQAEIFSQVGAECDSVFSSSSLDEVSSVDEDSVSDPMDTTCLIASLSQDSGVCESTTGQDGESCEWCSVGGYGICLNGDQADIASQAGVECGEEIEDIKQSESPYDTSCLVASLAGSDEECKSTTGKDGQSCQWCDISSVGLCLTADQAELAAEVGADCSSSLIAIAEE